MSDIFQEVDEDVRREQLLKLWRSYGTYIIAAIAIFVLFFGGYLAWKDYRRTQLEAEGARFGAALSLVREGKSADAAAAFATMARDAGAGYRALSGLQEAAARNRSKDVAGAVGVYDRLAQDSGVETVWRDLARILAVMHLFDTAGPEELDRRLAPLLSAPGPWGYTARELAALTRLKAGDLKSAREGLQRLADDAGAPAGVRARAAETLAALGGQG